MPYHINLSNGDHLVTIEEGTADVITTSLTLIGKNYAGYGESLNENLVRLLENFSNQTQPPGPIKGQLWYDNVDQILKVYNGENFVNSGAGVELNTNSLNVHYNVFVQKDSGASPFRVAGIKGMTVTPSTGNHAIGRSTPASGKLEVNNAKATLRIFNNFPQQSNGQEVGLHIHGDDDFNGRNTRIVLDCYGDNPGYDGIGISSIIDFRRARGSSNGMLPLKVNDSIGALAAHGFDGSVISGYQGYLVFRCDGDWSSSSRSTRLELFLTPRNSPINRMVLTVLGNGDVRAEGDVVAFTSSDARLKTNIKPIKDPLTKIKQISGVTFNWNSENLYKDPSANEVGLLAQQVQTIQPEAVIKRKTGYLAINYEKMIPLLVESIKALEQKITKLESKN
jgi:hypothetical protein